MPFYRKLNSIKFDCKICRNELQREKVVEDLWVKLDNKLIFIVHGIFSKILKVLKYIIKEFIYFNKIKVLYRPFVLPITLFGACSNLVIL